MLGDQSCSLFHDLGHFIATFCLIQIEKHGRDLVQRLPREFVSGYCVLEGRCLRIVDYCVQLFILFFYSRLNCRNVVAQLDLIERRNAIRGVPLLQKWIF